MAPLSFDVPTREEVIKLVDCPRCGAEAGRECERASEDFKKKKVPGNHRERMAAARDQIRRTRAHS